MTSDGAFDLISLSDIVIFMRRHFLIVVLCVTVGATCGFKGAGYIPKKYKSKATVTIQFGYFHHPLVSDTVAEIQDTSEMSTHRLAVVRAALTDQFLIDFSKTFVSPHRSITSLPEPVDIESVLKKIEYFSTNATTFQISVILHSAEGAFHGTNKVLMQIISTLQAQREQLLAQAKRALELETEMLLRTFSHEAHKSGGENVEAQLASTKEQLDTLEEHLAATHPDVMSLRNRLNRLQARHQEAAPSLSEADDIPNVFFSPQSNKTKQEIVDDLLKKISDLNIVLTMERQQPGASYVDIIEHPRVPVGPFAPNRIQFALMGAGAGLLLSLSFSVARELRRLSVFSPQDAAHFLEIPLLGELPSLTVESPPARPPKRAGPTSLIGACLAVSISCAG